MTTRPPINATDWIQQLADQMQLLAEDVERLRALDEERLITKQNRNHVVIVDGRIPASSVRYVNGKRKLILGAGVGTIYRRDVDSIDELELEMVRDGKGTKGEPVRLYNYCPEAIGSDESSSSSSGALCTIAFAVEDKWGDCYAFRACDVVCPEEDDSSSSSSRSSSSQSDGSEGSDSSSSGSSSSTSSGSGPSSSGSSESSGSDGSSSGSTSSSSGSGSSGSSGESSSSGGCETVDYFTYPGCPTQEGDLVTFPIIKVRLVNGRFCVEKAGECTIELCCEGSGSGGSSSGDGCSGICEGEWDGSDWTVTKNTCSSGCDCTPEDWPAGPYPGFTDTHPCNGPVTGGL